MGPYSHSNKRYTSIGAGTHRQHGVIPAPHWAGNLLDSTIYPWGFSHVIVARSLFCQGVNTQAWAWSVTLLLDDDGQVHIQMDATVEMIGAGGVEWSNSYTLTGRADLHIVDGRGTRFSCWLSSVVHPGAIANDV